MTIHIKLDSEKGLALLQQNPSQQDIRKIKEKQREIAVKWCKLHNAPYNNNSPLDSFDVPDKRNSDRRDNRFTHSERDT